MATVQKKRFKWFFPDGRVDQVIRNQFNMKGSNRFVKGERLKKDAIINRMFNREGKSVAVFPLRLIWLETELDSPFPAQFAQSVPRKNFKNATDRNKIRRKIREAYRLNKEEIYSFIKDQNRQYAFMILYTSKEKCTYSEIERKLKLLFERFYKLSV